jgi:hypothetical protein
VYFQTGEAEVSSDTDGGYQDVYDRTNGTTTTLVSTGPAGTNGAFDASYGGSTPDASHIYFMTKEVMTADDTDTSRDIYDRSGGTTTRVSTSSTAGNGAWNANMVGVSSDGSKVWFETREAMVPSDTDSGCLDSGGNPTLPCNDVYERSGGTTTLVSCCGNGAYDADFVGASDNGSVVFFRTGESQTGDDTDGGYQDIFQRSGGVTTLVSAGANGAHDAFWGGNSADGSRAFFQTNDAMTANDTDGGYQDVYERYAGSTVLLSTGPTATNAASQAFFDGNSRDGTVVFFETDEALTSADTDTSVDLYSSTQTFPGFARPKGAGPLTMKFVPAYQQCTSPNRTHGPSLSFPSCAPPTQESGVLTLGTPDNNGFPANSVSSVKLKVISTSPENVQLIMGINDVLCRAANAACPGGALSDYTGKLLLKLRLRVTDKYNGSPTSEGATVQDFDLGIPLQCTGTVSTLDGGTCQATTTVNALIPGAVQDGKRAIWQIDQGQVWDAGANGTGYGAGCPTTCGDGDESVFLRQGIFIP